MTLHCSGWLSEQGGMTQKSSSLESEQSERPSHSKLYVTASAPFLHVMDGGSDVSGAGHEAGDGTSLMSIVLT